MPNSKGKLMFVFWVMMSVFLVLLFKFFWIQVVSANKFQKEAVDQRVLQMVEQPERGNIKDRNGNPLVMSRISYDINIFPKFLDTKEKRDAMTDVFVEELGLKESDVKKKVSSKREWDNIAKKINPKKAQKIVDKLKEKHVAYVTLTQSPKREYLHKGLGASFLGFVNGIGEPGAGVELSLESKLGGVPGYTLAETYNREKVIPVGFSNNSTPIKGQEVTLTIDSTLQTILEDRLKVAMKEMEPVGVHAVIMNPNTGEVLAMASAPSFNPNNYQKYDPKRYTRNPASYVFEPGSTFKPIYMTNALEVGTINKDTHFYDGAGGISVNGTWIKNWNRQGLGDASLQDIITNSSNVGMIQISQTMTTKQILDRLQVAGIGSPTGVELPAEERGLFPTVDSIDGNKAKDIGPDPIRKATIAFGQGISVTPLQLVTAFSEIVNGGYDVKATMVKEIKDEFGNVHNQLSDKKGERVYKEENSNLMKGYLKANMEVGSGKNVQLDVPSGGKTGSAWVVDSETGAYKSGVIIGTFMGFAPYENPELAMLVVVDQPKNAEFGSTSAGPIYHDVMNEAIKYWNGKAEKEKKESKIVPKVEYMIVEDAKEEIKKTFKQVKFQVRGKGTVVREVSYAKDGDEWEATLYVEPLKGKETIIIPNVLHKTKNEVRDIFGKEGIKTVYHGDVIGDEKVKEQSKKPGIYDEKGVGTITLWME